MVVISSDRSRRSDSRANLSQSISKSATTAGTSFSRAFEVILDKARVSYSHIPRTEGDYGNTSATGDDPRSTPSSRFEFPKI